MVFRVMIVQQHFPISLNITKNVQNVWTIFLKFLDTTHYFTASLQEPNREKGIEKACFEDAKFNIR